MSRCPAILSVLILLCAANPTQAASGCAKTTARTTVTVSTVLTRSGAEAGTPELRVLLETATASIDVAESYAAQRTAIRACHAERYAQARDNVLTGRAQPLRSC